MLRAQPNNYWAFLAGIEESISKKQWSEARNLLDAMFKRAPNGFQTPKPYLLQAAVWRELKDETKEQTALENAVAVDGNQFDAFVRLTALETARTNWPAVGKWSQRASGMNPFASGPYRALAKAAEELNQGPQALRTYETLLKLEPLNPAALHFAIARLQHTTEPDQARRHLLLALEDAPRYREAHRLLFQLQRARDAATPGTAGPSPAEPNQPPPKQ